MSGVEAGGAATAARDKAQPGQRAALTRGVQARQGRGVLKVLVLLTASSLSLIAAEALARAIDRPEPYLGRLLQPDGSDVTTADAVAAGAIVRLPAASTPPDADPGFTFGGDVQFRICYEGLEREWLDDRHGVDVAINSCGVRDSADLTFEKPTGQRRVVCIGDSVTFGWGVPIEQVWTELVESDLRRDGGDVRTVNCGFCGTMMPDEAYYGLMHRFHRFGPDAVVMTLCLNDLFPANSGMLHLPPQEQSPSRLWNLMATWWKGGPTALPTGIDHGAALLAEARFRPGQRRSRYWTGGGTQRALRGARDWCRERDLPFVVVLWPFLQCLDERYPFTTIHRRVAAFCADEGIPLLDLLGVFRGLRDADLWIAPNDAHANPRAQRLAAPPIAAFLREHAL